MFAELRRRLALRPEAPERDRPTINVASPGVTSDDLPALEAELERIAAHLDDDLVVPGLIGAYAIALGRRGVTIWNGVRLLVAAGNVPGAAATTRPALEALILLGWLGADPEERLVRWHGESERSVRTMTTVLSSDPVAGRHARLTAAIPPDRLASREAAVAEARTKVATGVRLVPSVERMAEEADGGPTFWEAYQLAYRLLSAWEHHDHGTFAESLEDDGVSIEDAQFDPVQIRALAASVTAALLVVVGTIAGFADMAEEAQTIRRVLLQPSNQPGDSELSSNK